MLGWEFPPHISGGLGTACHGIVHGLNRAEVDVLFVIPRARGDEDGGSARVVGANQVPVEERHPLPPRRVSKLRAEVVPAAVGADLVPTTVGESASSVWDRLTGEPASAVWDRLTGEPASAVSVRSADELGDPPDLGWSTTELALDSESRDDARLSPRLEPADQRSARPLLDTRAIDSLLSPYLDSRGYRERLIAAARAEYEAAQRSRSGAPAAGVIVVPTGVSASVRDAEVRAADTRNGADSSVSAPSDASLSRARGAQSPTAHGAQSRATNDTAAPLAPPTLRTWIEDFDEPVPDLVTTRLLEFSGAYGRDLMGEVARYALAVESLARSETFDVIHAHDWMAVPAGVAAKRASGKKLIVHVHACEHDRSGDRPDTRVQGIEQLGLDEADIVVCVSHYTANVLKRFYRVDEAKLRVVHNALTQREQREKVHVEKVLTEPIVLFLGRITAQKGPEYFLEAAARVARVRPDVKFVIAGSGDQLGKTIELAASLGLARNTHFTGFLTGADVERMYAMADVYVMPSVSEPFGIAPLEAMALDVPVIVSRQSGVSEVLRSALKVDYWDVQGIAEKILAVLAYPGLSEQLEEEGRTEARAMRWDVPAVKLKEFYASLTGAA